MRTRHLLRVVKVGSKLGSVTMANHRCYLSVAVDNAPFRLLRLFPLDTARHPASGTGRSLSRELVAA